MRRLQFFHWKRINSLVITSHKIYFWDYPCNEYRVECRRSSKIDQTDRWKTKEKRFGFWSKLSHNFIHYATTICAQLLRSIKIYQPKPWLTHHGKKLFWMIKYVQFFMFKITFFGWLWLFLPLALNSVGSFFKFLTFSEFDNSSMK